tara:strand:+ start:483 stop:683 length:201 start_codon:yes stop_codon:yes gene_type:complete
MINQYESPERQWFAVHHDSTMSALGDCGDFQAANEIAQDMGLDPMWIVDPKTAKQWVDTFKTRGIK